MGYEAMGVRVLSRQVRTVHLGAYLGTTLDWRS